MPWIAGASHSRSRCWWPPPIRRARAAAGSSGGKPPIVTHHRIRTIDGIKIFYREAAAADAPVVLLLHGFPTSSHMFRNLIPEFADRYHVIAPDYRLDGLRGLRC